MLAESLSMRADATHTMPRMRRPSRKSMTNVSSTRAFMPWNQQTPALMFSGLLTAVAKSDSETHTHTHTQRSAGVNEALIFYLALEAPGLPYNTDSMSSPLPNTKDIHTTMGHQMHKETNDLPLSHSLTHTLTWTVITTSGQSLRLKLKRWLLLSEINSRGSSGNY